MRREICLFIFVLLGALYLPRASSAKGVDEYASNICREEMWPAFLIKGENPPFSMRKNDVLCIFGEIDRSGEKAALRTLHLNKIHYVVTTSEGGDAAAAIELATEIYKRKIAVIVWYYCFSSCANYLFMAGHEKYVMPDSVVGWHGAPPIAEPQSDASTRKISRQHRGFFRLIGVDDSLTRFLPCGWDKNGQFKEAVEADRHPLWTYPKDYLEKKYHIGGIKNMWEAKTQDEINDLFSITGKDRQDIYLFLGCN